MRQIRFNCGGDPGDDKPVVISDNPGPHGQEFATEFEGPSRLVVTFPQTHDIDGAATVKYQNRSKQFRVYIPPLGNYQLEATDPLVIPAEYHGDPDKVALHYGPAVPDEVQIVGDHFELKGKRWLVRGADGFCDLFVLLTQGPDALRPKLAQGQDLGVRFWRIFGCMKNIVTFNPFDYGDAYFQAIPELFKLYAEYGAYGEFDALPDCNYWGFSFDQCLSLWQRDVEVLTPVPNRFLSLTNEYNHGGNMVPDDGHGQERYPCPPFALCSQGSAVSDAPPPRPGWRIREFHRLGNMPKAALCEDMYYNREGVDEDNSRWGDPKPIYLSECIKFKEGDPSTDERLARTLALSSAAYGEGIVMHNEFGYYSQPMGPRVASCVKTAMDLLIRVEG